MKSLSIKILEPKAEKLIQRLVERKLISVTEDDVDARFIKAIKNIRSKVKKPLSMTEIQKEVDIVRRKRYA